MWKAQEAAGMKLPVDGTAFISVANRDKKDILEIAKKLKAMGFTILSTKGTKINPGISFLVMNHRNGAVMSQIFMR